MKKSFNLVLLSTLSMFVFSACSNHKEAIPVLNNELKIANECKNSNETIEHDCYDLMAYKNTFAQIRLGLLAQRNAKYKEAFQRYSFAQKNKNFYANALLADLYNQGLGVPKSKEKVLDLLKDTSDVDPIAAYKLAYYYLGEKDYDEAIELLTFAANNDLKKAQYDLYKIYGEGEITDKDLEKSKAWFLNYSDKSNSFIKKIYGR